MKKKKKKINDAIQALAQARETPFLFEDLAAYVQQECGDVSEERVWNAACASEFLFKLPNDSDGDQFLSRGAFFKGAEFLIHPAQAEIDDGYLFPGHRWIPYIAPDVFPARVRLILPDGQTLKTRAIKRSVSEITPFLSFFGEYGLIDYLILDHEKNSDALMPDADAPVKATVFDTQRMMKQMNVQPGDAFLFSVQDWFKGILSLRHLPAAKVSAHFERMRDWNRQFGDAFKVVVNDLNLASDCSEQLAQTLFRAGESALRNPPESFAAFFTRQENLTLKTLGQKTLFFPKDKDLSLALLDARKDGSLYSESEIDEFFGKLGLSLSSEEASAYIRDALFSGGTSSDEVLDRVMAGRELLFPSEEEQAKFETLWQELWDEVSADYCAETDPFGDVRHHVLELNDLCLQTLRELDRRGVDEQQVLQHPAFMQFTEITGMLSSTLELLNHPESQSKDGNRSLQQAIPSLREAIQTLSGDLLKGSPVLNLVSSENEKIYQLKISLKDTTPPIWRRILIPASFELDDLHEAIQAAMGWENSHLYHFLAGQTLYEPNADAKMSFAFDMEPIKGVRIAQLLRKATDQIEYEYDFGDSWQHTVTLEKILKPDPTKTYPVCIQGKRACPPEDCGGIWGYARLLEIMNNPRDPEHQEMMDWVGEDFDPKEFHLDETNGLLRSRFR